MSSLLSDIIVASSLRVIMRKYSLFNKKRIVMQIYIYTEDFFYNKILSTSKSLVEEILKDKYKYYTKRKIPKKMVFVLSTA